MRRGVSAWKTLYYYRARPFEFNVIDDHITFKIRMISIHQCVFSWSSHTDLSLKFVECKGRLLSHFIVLLHYWTTNSLWHLKRFIISFFLSLNCPLKLLETTWLGTIILVKNNILDLDYLGGLKCLRCSPRRDSLECSCFRRSLPQTDSSLDERPRHSVCIADHV